MLTRPKHCVSTHSRPKAAGRGQCHDVAWRLVSTHSRPKAAGCFNSKLICFKGFQHTAARRRLDHDSAKQSRRQCFNTQPPEGGWTGRLKLGSENHVSTHSRPKAAENLPVVGIRQRLFQHTAARRRLLKNSVGLKVTFSFNTQPPEGGCTSNTVFILNHAVSTHSRPKAAGRSRLLGYSP